MMVQILLFNVEDFSPENNGTPNTSSPTTAKVLFRACFACRVEPATFRHRACIETWWEDEADDQINNDNRGQMWMCDCEEC